MTRETELRRILREIGDRILDIPDEGTVGSVTLHLVGPEIRKQQWNLIEEVRPTGTEG